MRRQALWIATLACAAFSCSSPTAPIPQLVNLDTAEDQA